MGSETQLTAELEAHWHDMPELMDVFADKFGEPTGDD